MNCDVCLTPHKTKILYMGFPGRFCTNCRTLEGPASWVAALALYFKGGCGFIAYTGPYYKALYRFLTGK